MTVLWGGFLFKKKKNRVRNDFALFNFHWTLNGWRAPVASGRPESFLRILLIITTTKNIEVIRRGARGFFFSIVGFRATAVAHSSVLFRHRELDPFKCCHWSPSARELSLCFCVWWTGRNYRTIAIQSSRSRRLLVAPAGPLPFLRRLTAVVISLLISSICLFLFCLFFRWKVGGVCSSEPFILYLSIYYFLNVQ